MNRKDLILYAITDRKWLGEEKSLKEAVKEAIEGGATMIQLREKKIDFNGFIEIAKEIKQVTDKYRVPLIINDNVEVALAVDASGVHVGQEDLEAGEVRKKIGPEKILGVTAKTVEQAKAAEKAGADYLGTGALFPSPSKKNAIPVTKETLNAVCDAVSIPVVGIGGIDESNIESIKDTKIVGVAVISGIFAKKDIKKAAQTLRSLWEKE